VNRRAPIFLILIMLAIFISVHGAFSQGDAGAARRVINSASNTGKLPFSDGIQTGRTLYLSGKIGIDPKTGKAYEKIDDEIAALLENVKATLAQADMTMDDLAYVQVFCSDLKYYDKFNAAYRSNFTKEFPARAFIGVASLLRDGHFELQAIAVKR
jgi:2-iminobutanoate/2-iminopropanoate deaminase